MGWSIGYDSNWDRFVGYSVPSICDSPKCSVEIDRGLSYVCGGDPYGGEHGCGLFFCEDHLWLADRSRSKWTGFLCNRCSRYKTAYMKAKPDTIEWITHQLNDPSWEPWRLEHPDKVQDIQERLRAA